MSLMHVASIIVLVGTVSSGEAKRVRRRVRRGYVLRYLSLGLMLGLALRHGLDAGLLASAGFLVGRVSAVYLGHSKRINWMWFGL